MQLHKILFVVFALVASVPAQASILTGRSFSACTSTGQCAGTRCSATMSCTTPQLTAAVGSSLTCTVGGGNGGAYTIEVSSGMLACPISMPTLGVSLLAPPTAVVVAGTLTPPGSSGCSGQATQVVTVPSGSFALQAHVQTPSGNFGYTNAIRVN